MLAVMPPPASRDPPKGGLILQHELNPLKPKELIPPKREKVGKTTMRDSRVKNNEITGITNAAYDSNYRLY